MALDYTTTNTLLPAIRLLPLMPSVQALFSDSDLLSFLNLEMNSKIYPLIDNQSSEYFVYRDDIPYNSGVIVYDFPPRTIAGKLRSVSFVDANQNEVRLPQLRIEDIMSNVNSTGLAINPALWGFYVENNKIYTYLSSVNGGNNNYKTLRLRYIRQPNQLVANSACAQVTLINGAVITVTNVPSNYSTSVTYDAISNVPNFNALGDDLVCTNISSLTMTFSAAIPNLKVGDWICLSGQAPLAQIPYNPGYDLLMQLGAAKALEVAGDVQGYNIAMSQAATMKDYFISVISPRIDGNVIRLTTPNSIYGWD
jgi:hypothetical protein